MSKYRIKKQYTNYAIDTETYVYAGQKSTGVWSLAMMPYRTQKQMEKGMPAPCEDDYLWFNSIDGWIEYLEKQDRNISGEIHNLKFDGSFIVDWLYDKGYVYDEKGCFKKTKHPKSFHTLVGDMGQWYSLEICLENGKTVKIHDSFKIAPFSLKKLCDDFDVAHKKLEMDYTGKDHTVITDKEKAYIRNDVWGLSEILEAFSAEGIEEMTDAGAALARYKESIPKTYFTDMFVDLSKIKISEKKPWNKEMQNHDFGTYKDVHDKAYEIRNVETADEYIRKAYHGGFCYTDPRFSVFQWSKETLKKAKGNAGKQIYQYYRQRKEVIKYIGLTLDVNSLYPSMMHSMSGSVYPVGMPHFLDDPNKIMQMIRDPERFAFIRFTCSFRIKPNHIPFIQIKRDPRYKSNEMLTTSLPSIKSLDSENLSDIVEMTMSEVDFKLFEEHYSIYDFHILDGCWFYTDSGMFDAYIDYWMKIKQTSTGSKRAIAKLMLNSLYGRFAISPTTYSKIPIMKDGILGYELVKQKDKKPLYIPIGCAITAYARAFTIRAAQQNYKYFAYADTDSLHLLCQVEDVKGVNIDAKKLCCWKAESFWDIGYFVRQKTYIEHVTYENQKPIENPYYNVKCAGMPQECKDLYLQSVLQKEEDRQTAERKYDLLNKMLSSEEKETDDMFKAYKFLKDRRSVTDFNIGLRVPGKLIPKRMPGGIVLVSDYYTMREKPGLL